MKKFQIFHEDGEITVLPNGKLETLQTAVGGLVERLCTGPNEFVYVNEEGKLNGMKLNPGATLWCGTAIYGPMVVFDHVG